MLSEYIRSGIVTLIASRILLETVTKTVTKNCHVDFLAKFNGEIIVTSCQFSREI